MKEAKASVAGLRTANHASASGRRARRRSTATNASHLRRRHRYETPKGDKPAFAAVWMSQ